MFHGREQFSHEFTGLAIERAWLDRVQTSLSPELHSILLARTESLLSKAVDGAPTTQRVTSWIVARQTRNRPTMNEVARGLGMSARSLRRRLHEERASFNTLLVAALVIRAKRLLADPACSVQEAAYQMGFTAAAAFSRAFKRWTGSAPRAAQRSVA